MKDGDTVVYALAVFIAISSALLVHYTSGPKPVQAQSLPAERNWRRVDIFSEENIEVWRHVNGTCVTVTRIKVPSVTVLPSSACQ